MFEDENIGTDGAGEQGGAGGDSTGAVPDTITSFEELQKHLNGGGKDGSDKDDTPQTVSIDDFNALKAQMENIGKDRELLVGIINRLANNRPGAPAQPQEVNFFPELEDQSDFPTAAQMNKAMANMMNVMRQALSGVTAMAGKPDYGEVTKLHLPSLLQERPELAQAIQSGNLAEITYHLADLQRQLKNPKKGDGKGDGDLEKNDELVQRILKNLDKPGAAQNTGGNIPSNSGKYVDNLSDEEFAKLYNKVVGGQMKIPR